ncbi:MAG: M48 family metalloprotease [bacterium]|nr:M48 family metalloprotease [bacterium]
MFEWFSEQYIRLMINYQILSGDANVACYAVDWLRIFSFALFFVFLFKASTHLVISYRLKRQFTTYSETTYPDVFSLYRIAAHKVGLRRLPALYRFFNDRPVVFTIGFIKPTVFLAPILVKKLSREELEAVLVHELTHVKRWDNLLKWVLEMFFLSIPVLIIQLFALGFVFNGRNSELAIWGALATIVLFRVFLWDRILYLRELSCDDLSVDAIRDPLVLASSLISVWRAGQPFPKCRWQLGLAFVQTFLPVATSFEARVKRLMDYQRPRFKFMLGRATRVAAFALMTLTVTFLWRFYADHRYYHLHIDPHEGIYICDHCEITQN